MAHGQIVNSMRGFVWTMGACACGCDAGSGGGRGSVGKTLTHKRIGSLGWARETGGVVDSSQRDAVYRKMIEGQARCLADLSRPAREAFERMDLDAIRIPDSALARKIETHVAALSPDALVNHVYRTFYWGSLLAQADDVEIEDVELFFAASVLHDLGIVAPHRFANPEVKDFSIDGGLAAYDFLVAEGVTPERAEAAAEAIILHVQVISGEFGSMAQYLHEGAWTDLSAMRASDVPPSIAREVIDKYPALDIRDVFGKFAVEEITTRTDSRFALAAAAGQALNGVPLYPWPDRPERIG